MIGRCIIRFGVRDDASPALAAVGLTVADLAAKAQAERIARLTTLSAAELYSGIRTAGAQGLTFSDEAILDAIQELTSTGFSPSDWRRVAKATEGT